MSNDVTTPNKTGMAALGALRSGLQTVRTKMPEIASSPYLRLLKDGDWVFGQEDNAIAKGTEAVINPLSVKHGYSCWTNRQPGEGKNVSLGEIMVGLNTPLQAIHELEAHKDPETGRPAPWKDQMSVDVKFVTGKHKGTQVMWKVSSVGGLNAAKGILDAILARLDEATPFVCPIVTLDSDSYKHATYGKTYVPKIEVVGWMDLEGNEEGDDVVAGPEAVKRVEKQPEPEPEPEVEEAEVATDEPPRRRRRVA
jgi:hypothetical protein